MKKTSQCGLALVLFLCLCVQPFSANRLSADISTHQLTQPEMVETDWQTYQEIPDYFQLAAENDIFQLYVDEATIAFKVVDKRSGYIWHSNLDEKGEEDRLNRTWTAFARSGISIDFLDPEAISTRASITNAEVALDVRLVEEGFDASITFLEPSISILVAVRLEPDGVSVEVPFESIREDDPNFKLGTLHLYPFFAATRDDSVPGYMFIPDGCGSLIRFSDTTKAANMYYGRYYGTDLGMITTLPYDPMINRPFKISIPVVGMVHGYKQNAYISIIEKGASYGEIHAHPSGIITNFNFIYNMFIYNESYFQATNRSGAGVTTLQPQTNAFDILVHYRFLTQDDSDYVGMARNYQQYLIDKGVLRPITGHDEDIPIRLEFLGGEKERILFWYRSIPMTTVNQMAEILNSLDINNPEVVYYGWQPLGASAMPPHSLRLDNNLGDLDEVRSIIDYVESDGGNFYLYLDPQAAFVGEGGYSTRHDLAMSITNFNLMGYNRSKINYYLNYRALSENYTDLSNDLNTELEAGWAVDEFGSMLYSDFKRNNYLNREEAISMYQSLLAENAVNTSFYTPNDYMFAYTSAYYDMPITNSGYIYTSDAVPFLQIAFAGYIPYYGPVLNFSSDIRVDLLKHIDFGVYPTFFLSHGVTANILNTDSSWIYTSSIAQWEQEIERSYQWLNELLGPVRGQTIIARDVLEEGIIATTYSNNMQIIVNYTASPYAIGDIVIESEDAVIREVLP